MRFFEEKQGFNHWWIYAIIAFNFTGCIFLIINESKGPGDLEEMASFLIPGFVVMLLVSGMFFVRLTTRIDSTGVYARFSPLGIFSKHFLWNEITEIFVRKYSPIAEYGGWGIRGFGRAKAYSTSGNHGIQIETKDGRRFLIGTHQPEKVKQVLKKYQDKINPRR